MSSVTDGSQSNGVQPVDEQPYAIDEVSCAGAPRGRGLAKRGEQLANMASSMRRYLSSNSFSLVPRRAHGLIWGGRYQKMI